jgi:hypothetical protein
MNRRLFLMGAGSGVLVVPAACGADDKPTPTYRSSDVELIAAWLLGQDAGNAFDGNFGDSKWLTKAKDAVAYTDVAGVRWPKGLRSVPYDFVQARLDRIRSGGKVSPAVVIAGSIPADPPEDGGPAPKLDALEAGERYYHVEVGIGNTAWHWLKITIRDVKGKPQAKTIRAKVS